MKQLVTIIMPVYNCEPYIEEAIESILNQTYKKFKFVIVDDASTDNTLEIIQNYLIDSRIELVENSKRVHLPKCLNKEIRRCCTKYIARMDGDDISEPTRLEKQVKFMEENPEVVLLGTQGVVIDEHSKYKEDLNKPTKNWHIKGKLMESNVFIHGSVVIRRESLMKTALYDESFIRGQDYPLWLDMIKLGKVANLSEPLYRWRVYHHVREDSENDMLVQKENHEKIVREINEDHRYSYEKFLLFIIKLVRVIKSKWK